MKVQRRAEKGQLVQQHAAQLEEIAKRLHLKSKGARLESAEMLDTRIMVQDIQALVGRAGALLTVLMED